MADGNELDLSVTAAACMRERLPGLLAVVRARRRRRRAGLAAWLLLGVVVLASPWWRAPAPHVPKAAPVAVVPAWTVVRDDPTVVARHTVTVAPRAEWYVVDDGELQALLAADHREAGLVRARGQLLVSRAAIDPFPGSEP